MNKTLIGIGRVIWLVLGANAILGLVAFASCPSNCRVELYALRSAILYLIVAVLLYLHIKDAKSEIRRVKLVKPVRVYCQIYRPTWKRVGLFFIIWLIFQLLFL